MEGFGGRGWGVGVWGKGIGGGVGCGGGFLGGVGGELEGSDCGWSYVCVSLVCCRGSGSGVGSRSIIFFASLVP